MAMIYTQPDITMATPPFSTEQKDGNNVGKLTIEQIVQENLQTYLFVLYARIILETLAKIPLL